MWKFLIDKNQQNKGYGREALKLGMAYLKDNLGINEIYTGVAIGKVTAKHLYRSIGFEETGLLKDNMEEMKIVW